MSPIRYIGDVITTEMFLFLMTWVIIGLTGFFMFVSWAEREGSQ